MNIFRSIARALQGPRSVAPPLSGVARISNSGDWRKKKLAEAAKKYGKPFNCAADDMPRQVMVRGQVIVINGTSDRSADV